MILTSDSYGYEYEHPVLDLSVNRLKDAAILAISNSVELDTYSCEKEDKEQLYHRGDTLAVLSVHDLRMWAVIFEQMADSIEMSAKESK